MKRSVYVSSIVLIACFCIVKLMVSADFSQDTKKTRSVSYNCILDGEQESTSVYDCDDFYPESDSHHISFVISNTFKKPVTQKVSVFCYLHSDRLIPIAIDLPPPFIAI